MVIKTHLPRPALIPGGKLVNFRRWSGIPHPLNRLPVGHQPNVVHLHQGVQKGFETFFVMRLREPGRVVIEAKWRAVRRVVAFEVLKIFIF